MIDATTEEFAAGDRFREEAARKSQRVAVDQKAREMEAAEAEAAEAAHTVEPVVTAEAEAAPPIASAAYEGMEMEH